MKVDIALLTWNFPRMTIECLKAVKQKTSTPYRIIWVDNGSTEENFELVKKVVETFDDYTIFRFDDNEFYARGTNKGIELSRTKYVVTLSNDVFVTKNWLKRLVSIMENNPNIGLLSPMTDNIGSNGPRASYMIPRYGLLEPDKPFSDVNKLPERFYYCDDNVSMFCALLRREMIDKIGMLDERFTCYGNDDDYNDRIKQTGWKSAVALNCFVYHIHKVTKNQVFSPEEKRIIRREHRELLWEKRKEREQRRNERPY